MTEKPITLYTASYSAVLRDGWPVGSQLVRTSVGEHDQLRGLSQVHALTPYGILGAEWPEPYTHLYVDRLEKIGVKKIERAFQIVRGDADALVLLCFEPDRRNCHRGLFAAWWEQQTGEVVLELKVARP